MLEIIKYILVGLFLIFIVIFTIFGAKKVGESLGEYMYENYKK